MEATLVMLTAIVLGGLYMLVRIDFVYQEKIRVLGLVSALNKSSGYTEFWRYDAFGLVTFEEMTWQFWRPVNSFYQDHPCLVDTTSANFASTSVE